MQKYNRNMKKLYCLVLVLVSSCALFAQKKYNSPQEFWADVKPLLGPIKADLGDNAVINIPKGYIFLNADDTKKFMVLTGNIYNNEIGTVMPDNGYWFVVFDYEDSGYVKEEKVDADAIFDVFKENEAESNERKKELGYPPLYIKDWFLKPTYNSDTKNLEWALLFEDDQKASVVNYSSRILGRTGFLSAMLVMEVNQKQALNDFQTILKQVEYKPGSRYVEWKEGDKVAEYGLAALITGGAAVVAAKTGLLAKFWKLIVVAVAVIGGYIAKIYKKITGARS